MNDTEHLQGLNAIQDEINRLSEQAWLKLMALLREGETPRDAIKEVQAAFSGEYETALLAAFNQRLSGYMGKTELNALNISGLTLSQRLYRHNQLTTHSVLNIINDHTKGFHDAQKLALQIYGGYHFRANEPLAVRVPLPKYLRAPFGDDAAFKALWRSQYAGSKLAGLADSAGTGPSLAQLYARINATNLKTPALKAAYLQALDALEKGAGQEQLKNVLKTAYYERNRYFANRIAQTELHRAYTDQKALDLMADGSFEYVQIRLSGTHPRADICDLHAKIDKYGLGAGVYPKAKAPKPPFHPHCRCLLTQRAWVDGTPKEQSHAEQAFLNGLPVDEAMQVIGSADKLQRMRKGDDFAKVINAGRPERYHLQRLGEFGGNIPRMDAQEKKVFADWAGTVTQPDYKPRHEFKQVGWLPDFVMVDAAVKALAPVNNQIHVSDHQLKHAIRTSKNERSAALKLSDIYGIPDKLTNARWFFDELHKNIFSAFDADTNNKKNKAVIAINFEKHKTTRNSIVTLGIIATENLGMTIYREIK